MDMKIGQKDKPKFAPPSAREKQRQGHKTSKSNNEETVKELKIHREVDEKITVTPTAEQKNKNVGIQKAKHMSDKHKLLIGLSKKGTGEENKEKKKIVNVITQAGGRAGSIGNSIASQSVSDDGPEREVIEKKVRKEKVKNKQQELDTRKDRNGNEVTNEKKQVQRTGEVRCVQKDKEKKRRKKTDCIPKIKEKQEHKEKPSVALTDSQYEDVFDSVLHSAQLETCMEDARAMLSEVELLQASIDQEVNKMREKEEEVGDICQEKNEHDILEDRREKMDHRHKEDKSAKIGCRKRRTEEEDHEDREADEYDSWVQCSRATCKKWRRMHDDTDPSTLPKNWTCRDNIDPAHSSCDAPEECWSVSKEEEFYYCSLVPGSMVWAQQTGYPWWPAMIERDPVTKDFLLFKTRRDPFPLKCHVTYFGSPVSRAWVQCCRVRGYNDLPEQTALNMVRQPVYKRKLKDAIKMAGQAQKVSLQKRLNKFGFMTRRATVEENLEEDSDIEEILALIAETSGKGRKRAKGSDSEEVRHPQKQRKHTEGRVEEPNDEPDLPSGTETTEDAGKMENEENKEKAGDRKENSETEADQSRATERKENTKEAGKKAMKKPEKERMKKGKKGTEKKENWKKGADLQGTKEMQSVLKKQDENTGSKEGQVKEQQQCPLIESDDQAVPESAVETSLEVGEDEEKEPEMQREEAGQMQKETDKGQKTEEVTPVEVEENMREVGEEEQKEEEEGDKDEAVVGKDKTEKTQKPEQCVEEGLGLSDDEDNFLDTDMDIMACRDDLMKSLCAEEEEEELIVLFEE